MKVDRTFANSHGKHWPKAGEIVEIQTKGHDKPIRGVFREFADMWVNVWVAIDNGLVGVWAKHDDVYIVRLDGKRKQMEAR
jgi:hypothetical protein